MLQPQFLRKRLVQESLDQPGRVARPVRGVGEREVEGLVDPIQESEDVVRYQAEVRPGETRTLKVDM